MGAVTDALVGIVPAWLAAVARERMNCYYSDDFSFIAF
jgi:hypothetical protein